MCAPGDGEAGDVVRGVPARPAPAALCAHGELLLLAHHTRYDTIWHIRHSSPVYGVVRYRMVRGVGPSWIVAGLNNKVQNCLTVPSLVRRVLFLEFHSRVVCGLDAIIHTATKMKDQTLVCPSAHLPICPCFAACSARLFLVFVSTAADSVAQAVGRFDSLCKLILKFPELASSAKFVFVPGPQDPGAGDTLPRPPVRQPNTEYFHFCNRAKNFL